jgi:hypothetical protein
MNEHFWSIVIEQDIVQAAIWTIRDENVAILATSKPQEWDTEDDLVKKTDAVLSEAINDFPEDAKEPNKTVFGVPASWVEDGKIKKPHLDKIKKVSQKLSLSPTGFVVLPEAIAHSVKIKEGSPLSGVVIGVGAGSLDLTVFRLGNIIGTVSVGRSGALIDDMVEGLSRFSSSDNVPTRWILYDGLEVDLEDVKQELVKADWKEVAPTLKFLHTPQVEIFGVSDKIQAVSISGASEIGEIKGVEGVEIPKNADSNVKETNDLSPEDLGFVIDQDISEKGEDSLGETEPAENSDFKVTGGVEKESVFAPITSLMNRIKLPKRAPKEPVIHGSGKSKVKRILIALAILVVLLVAGAVFAWLNFVNADVTIHIAPKNLQESEVIVLDENIDAPILEDFTFPAESIEAEVTSEQSRSATGSITVGDAASGTVTIRNGTAEEVSFDAGTEIGGPNDLSFTLDEAVTVPEAESPTTPGSVSVGATAAAIGADYNLASGESFSVGNFPKSEVDAVNESEFSGGSSEEITAISESDIDGLRDDLVDSLKGQAKKQLEGKTSGARFISDAVRYEVTDESASGSAGDEADSVSITMTMKAIGLVIPEEQINELSQLILKDQIPEGFSLKSEQVKAEFDLADEIDEGVWEFDVSLVANLLPSINIDAVKSEIVGKSPASVENYLSQIPGYVRAVVVVRPKLPGILGNLPRMEKNISLEIVAEQ